MKSYMMGCDISLFECDASQFECGVLLFECDIALMLHACDVVIIYLVWIYDGSYQSSKTSSNNHPPLSHD